MQHELPPVFEELTEAIILFSRDGRPIDSNAATEELLGYDQTEIIQTTLADLIVPSADLTYDVIDDHITEALEDEGSKNFEWQIQRSNGEPRWVEVTVSPITLDDTRNVLAEFRDLTAYKARGRRLQLLYRVLRHNLRNRMTVIQSHAEMLADAIEPDDMEQQIEIIRECAKDVGELGDAVAELERLVERDATERKEMNVAEVIQDVVSEIQERHPDVHIEATMSDDTWVSADEGFQLALEHALTNAVEHNDTDDPEVIVSQEATDREAIIQIADNGPGIPEMEINALDDDPTAVEHGEGLGLSIINWCTQSLGGTVDIEQADERGTNLTIQLPRLN